MRQMFAFVVAKRKREETKLGTISLEACCSPCHASERQMGGLHEVEGSSASALLSCTSAHGCGLDLRVRSVCGGDQNRDEMFEWLRLQVQCFEVLHAFGISIRWVTL